jgi:hypothetical protein
MQCNIISCADGEPWRFIICAAHWDVLSFVDRTSLYNLVNKTNLVHNLFLVYLFLCKCINLYMFRPTMCPSSGETTVFVWHWVLWMTVVCRVEFIPPPEWIPSYIQQSSTHNNKYQVSHKYSCFSWWWAHSRPKHVRKEANILRKIVHQVGYIYKITVGCLT